MLHSQPLQRQIPPHTSNNQNSSLNSVRIYPCCKKRFVKSVALQNQILSLLSKDDVKPAPSPRGVGQRVGRTHCGAIITRTYKWLKPIWTIFCIESLRLEEDITASLPYRHQRNRGIDEIRRTQKNALTSTGSNPFVVCYRRREPT